MLRGERPHLRRERRIPRPPLPPPADLRGMHAHNAAPPSLAVGAVGAALGLSFPLLTPMSTLGNKSAQGQAEVQVWTRGKKEADVRHQLGTRPYAGTTSSSSH